MAEAEQALAAEAALAEAAAWPPRDGRGRFAWSDATAAAILERVAAGEPLRAICRSPGLPGVRTVRRWMAARPAFAAAVQAARLAAGWPPPGARSGRPCGYCRETAQAIFARMLAGEGVAAICADPSMPAASTFYRWRAEIPEFDQALRVARDLQGEALFEKTLAICEGVTRESARADEVRLRHLRWAAAKLAPRKYGWVKGEAAAEAPEGSGAGAAAVEAGAEAGAGGGLTVVVKRFVLDGTPGGREAEEAAEVLYHLTPEQMAGRIEGEHPAVAAWNRGEPEREAFRSGFRLGKRQAWMSLGTPPPGGGPAQAGGAGAGPAGSGADEDPEGWC